MKILYAVLVVLTMASFSSAQQSNTSADFIFMNGDIYVGSKTPAAIPGRVQAMAVSGGKISAIGSNEDIQKHKGPKTQVVDLGGHFVMPGFNDAHVHLGMGGFEKLNVDLVGSK